MENLFRRDIQVGFKIAPKEVEDVEPVNGLIPNLTWLKYLSAGLLLQFDKWFFNYWTMGRNQKLPLALAVILFLSFTGYRIVDLIYPFSGYPL